MDVTMAIAHGFTVVTRSAENFIDTGAELVDL